MIECECPHCHRLLKIRNEFAGVSGRCNHCGGQILVPWETPSNGAATVPDHEDSSGALDTPVFVGDEQGEQQEHEEAPRPPGEEQDGTGAGSDAYQALMTGFQLTRKQLDQSRQDLKRMAKDLETVRAVKREADTALEHAKARMARLEEKLAATTRDNDSILFRVDLERAEAQLKQTRRDVERLAKDLEEERTAHVETKAALKTAEGRARRLREQLIAALKKEGAAASLDAEPGAPEEDATPEGALLETLEAQNDVEHPGASEGNDETPTPQGARLSGWLSLRPRRVTFALFGVLVVLVASLWLPGHAATRAYLAARLFGVSKAPPSAGGKPGDARAVLPNPHTGEIDAVLRFVVPSEGEEDQELSAANAHLVLARQRLDQDRFYQVLLEAGVAEQSWEPFADWYFLTETKEADAKEFLTAEGLDEAAFGLERAALATFAEDIGRDTFVARMQALTSFDPPAKWHEYTASTDATLLVAQLLPGRYLLFARPPGPRAKWEPLTDETAKELETLTILKGRRTKADLKLKDWTSTIRGHVVDAETGQPMPKASVVLSGDVTAGEDATLAADAKGAFEVDPLKYGYGAFALHCEPLPKKYAASTSFNGTRAPGVPVDPITIQVSKDAAPKTVRTPRISGRVLNPDGTAAPGFTIYMVGQGGSANSVARSGRDGTYMLEHKGGPMRLYASGRGTAQTEPISLELQRNESVTRDFVVPKTGRIVLSIATPDGQPPERFDECTLVSQTRVYADPAMLERMGDRFAISYLIPGAYDLTFKVNGFKPVALADIGIDQQCSDQEFSVTLEPAD